MRGVLSREVGEAQVQSALEADKSGWQGRAELIDNLKFVSQFLVFSNTLSVIIAVALSRCYKTWSTTRTLLELNLPYPTVKVAKRSH